MKIKNESNYFPGYDILLLTVLSVMSISIAQIERNYHEGACFFGTSVGLLVTWTIWITSFLLTDTDCSDFVVAFGILCTAYVIIIGVLVPRVYFMVSQMGLEKEFKAREYMDPRDLRSNNAGGQVSFALSFTGKTMVICGKNPLDKLVEIGFN